MRTEDRGVTGGVTVVGGAVGWRARVGGSQLRTSLWKRSRGLHAVMAGRAKHRGCALSKAYCTLSHVGL